MYNTPSDYMVPQVTPIREWGAALPSRPPNNYQHASSADVQQNPCLYAPPVLVFMYNMRSDGVILQVTLIKEQGPTIFASWSAQSYKRATVWFNQHLVTHCIQVFAFVYNTPSDYMIPQVTPIREWGAALPSRPPNNYQHASSADNTTKPLFVYPCLYPCIICRAISWYSK